MLDWRARDPARVEREAQGRPPAPEPRADVLLRIQRSAGNRAAAAIAQQARGPLLQRVSEKKLSFIGADGADGAEVDLLRQAIASLGDTGEKSDFESKTLAHMGTGKSQQEIRDRQKIVMQDYAAVLAKGDSLTRLLATPAFTTGPLKLGPPDAAKEFYPVLGTGGKTIATLSVGEASHIPDLESEDEDPKSERVTLTKLDKPLQQYVEDDRGIATRRYAYCEKSFFQFMEFVATHAMSGRFQTLQRALGEKADVFSVTPGMGKSLAADPTAPLQKLASDQLAVLHQWMGNGMQQRGLSLTSTPRERATFGNEGIAFREADGVRLKIDLFKVPADVILINHYSADGIQSHSGGRVNPGLIANQPAPGRREKYGYARSVMKNREVYLERLDPDWVEAIDWHGAPASSSASTPSVGAAVTTVPVAPKTGAGLLDEIGKLAGAEDYVKGFGATVQACIDKTPVPDTTGMAGTPFAKGVGSGTMYWEGYQAGKDERTVLLKAVEDTKQAIEASYTGGGKNKTEEARLQTARGKASQLKNAKKGTVADLGTALVCDTIADQDLAAMKRIQPTGWLALTTLAKERDKKAIYWVGWAHAARGAPANPKMDENFYGPET
jgi:hypothetical protein